MEVSVRRVKDKKGLDNAVDDAQAEGWSLKNQSDNVAVLEKRGGLGGIVGHVLVAICTIWWTFGIGNLVYAIVRYVKDTREMRIKKE